MITLQSGLIQSDQRNISFTSIVFQTVLSIIDEAELSTTIVLGTQAFTRSCDVFLHWYSGLVSVLYTWIFFQSFRAFTRISITDFEWQCVNTISQSWIKSDHISDLIFSSLSIHHRYSQNASAILLESAHHSNFDFVYFMALRSNGSVSLASISICEASLKNFHNSSEFVNPQALNSCCIILHASLAIFVAHWIVMSLISCAIFSTFFKLAILFLLK